MKNLYTSPEFKRVTEFTDDELRKINVKSIMLMQEVLTSKPLEPSLKITMMNERVNTVMGYENVFKEFQSMIKKIDFLAESPTPLYQTICSVITSHMPSVAASYVGADIYRISKPGTKQSIDIVIREKEINGWLETGAMSIGMIGRQLVTSIEAEFERKYGYTKQLFHFNGVYWSTDRTGNGTFSVLDNDEVQVMFANTTDGIWNVDGKFEMRHDARTWNADETFESVMRKYCGVSEGNTNLAKTLSEIPASLTKPTNLEFMDISTEEYRIYEYHDGKQIKIKLPVQLNVSKSGGHRILDKADMSHYIPVGWRHLFWKVKPGMKPFSF